MGLNSLFYWVTLINLHDVYPAGSAHIFVKNRLKSSVLQQCLTVQWGMRHHPS